MDLPESNPEWGLLDSALAAIRMPAKEAGQMPFPGMKVILGSGLKVARGMLAVPLEVAESFHLKDEKYFWMSASEVSQQPVLVLEREVESSETGVLEQSERKIDRP